MRYGIFSDIHANLEALEAVIAALNKESIDVFLCPGDIVGYGVNPNECVERIQELKAVSVAGNHDLAVLGRKSLDYFNPLAKEAVVWTLDHISGAATQYLESLPLTFKDQDVSMVHASLPYPEEFDYVLDQEAARRMFSVMEKNICFIGHTHVPLIIKQDNQDIEIRLSVQTKIEAGCRYIVNVGSVGQPRDGDPRAAYCIFDSASGEIMIKRAGYDVKKTQKKFTTAGLPQALASRLGYGE